MSLKPSRPLEERVAQAAEAALSDHGYVSPLDVFTGMGLLAHAHVEDWRNGRVPHLEPFIQGSETKISRRRLSSRNG
jgi:hypothetical protein